MRTLTVLRFELCLLLFLFGCVAPSPPAPEKPKAGVLDMDGEPDAWTASDAGTFDQLQRACNAKDERALRALIRAGFVQVHARGTKVTVVEESTTTCKVRIDDDTPHKGKVYVTWPEFVKR